MAETNDDKVIGILSYLGILWVVAYIMYGNKKTEYNAFHVKEGLGVLIAYVGLMIVVNILYAIGLSFLGGILSIGYAVVAIVAILAIISAAKGEMKPVPIISGLITENFLKNFK